MLLPLWRKWFKGFASSSRRGVRKARRARLWLDQLEDRTLLSTFLVTQLGDSGPGSLRQAVLDANNAVTHPGADIIRFDPALVAAGATSIDLQDARADGNAVVVRDAAGDVTKQRTEGGCSCAVGGATNRASGLVGLLLAIFVVIRRRRHK